MRGSSGWWPSLAAKTKAELIAVHVVEIDWTLPLDADIAGRSEEVQHVLDSAEAIAEAFKVRMEPVLLQARDVAAAIVDEATERGADLLVSGLPYRKRFGGEFAIGRTIPYILQNAPCTVWVVREPMNEEALMKIVIVGCGRVGAVGRGAVGQERPRGDRPRRRDPRLRAAAVDVRRRGRCAATAPTRMSSVGPA